MTTVLLETQASAPARETPSSDDERPLARTSLVDLLDRLLGTGVVLAGDVVISLAGVDLVQVRLHALISTVRAEHRPVDGGGR